MAQTPIDQNFFHPHPHPHSHQPQSQSHSQPQHQLQQQQQQQSQHQHLSNHAHGQTHSLPHPQQHPPPPPLPPTHTQLHPPPPPLPPTHTQLQLPPQFRNPFDLLFDERSGINYNYIRPYIPNQMPKQEELNDSLVMRRPRRTRTTFTSAQIAELERQFLQTKYLSSSRLAELSAKLALGTAQVKIWFKNRRRRHKIQSDQQKEFLSTSFGGEVPPSTSPNISSMQDDTARPVGSLAPPNIQTLTLGGSGGSASVTLTPSPTPSGAPANLMEPYCDAFNSPYYFNTQHGFSRALVRPPPSLPPPHHMLQTHSRQHISHYPRPHPPPAIPDTNAASVTAQYFAPPPGALQRPRQQLLQEQSYYNDQRRYPGYQPHKSVLVSDVLISSGDNQSMNIKDEPDYNFNSPYYMRMPERSITGAVDAPSTTVANANAIATELSPNPNPNADVYEPLTPKNDESPSLSNSNNSASSSSSSSASSINSSVGVADHMDDDNNTKTLQVLRPMRNNAGSNDTCGNGYSTIQGINMADCSGAFAKYTKLTAISSDTHESSSNYQCTMDTIMHAYNTHHSTTSSTQFAYCFN